MNKPTLSSTITLNDGNDIPRLGFGLYELTDPEETRRAVLAALEAGYRHFDDAALYRNEEIVGHALIEGGVPRDELYLTSKCWIDDFGREATREAFYRSLERLQMDYLDLYLLHWPVDDTMMEAWETLVELQEEGLCRSIGVSNFSVARFTDFFFENTGTVPAVNQIECHPLRLQADVQAYGDRKGMVTEAYSPLGRGEALEDPQLLDLAKETGKTPAQIIIRWHLQRDRVVIPKSAHPERIRQNADVFDFELTEKQLARIDALDRDRSVIPWRPGGEENWY